MSTSDEDSVSETEVEEAIMKAMNVPNVPTTTTNATKLSMCSSSKQPPPSLPTFTHKHRLIYQSFTKSPRSSQNNDSDSSNSSDDESILDGKDPTIFYTDKNQTDTGVTTRATGNDTLQFYIDKSSASDTPRTDIDVFDLSNVDTCRISDRLDEESRSVTCDEATEEKTSHSGPSHSKMKMKKDYRSKDKSLELSSSLQSPEVAADLYVNVDPFHHPDGDNKHKHDGRPELEVMKKSVIGDEFEKQEHATTTLDSVRQQKKQRKREREKTKGGKWYEMPATELTEERKHDFSVLQMRKALDPKRFYKGNDYKAAPKYFQFGTVVESAADFYNSRIPKKERKATLVEELLADAQFRQYNKRKYEEIQEVKRQGKGPYRHMKRLRKRKR